MSKAPPSALHQKAPEGSRFAIVCARWNEEITERLLQSAIATFREFEIEADRLSVVRVPGAFELPVAADVLAKSKRFAAVICFGAVVQGDTDHDRYINESIAHAFQSTALATGVPVIFGVLTCRTMEQAFDRAGGKAGNKGTEAVHAAIEMASVLRKLSTGDL